MNLRELHPPRTRRLHYSQPLALEQTLLRCLRLSPGKRVSSAILFLFLSAPVAHYKELIAKEAEHPSHAGADQFARVSAYDFRRLCARARLNHRLGRRRTNHSAEIGIENNYSDYYYREHYARYHYVIGCLERFLSVEDECRRLSEDIGYQECYEGAPYLRPIAYSGIRTSQAARYTT